MKHIILLLFVFISCSTPVDVEEIGNGAQDSFTVSGSVWSGNKIVVNTPVKLFYSKSGSSGGFEKTSYTNQYGDYKIIIKYGTYKKEYTYKVKNGAKSFNGITNRGSAVIHNFIF